MSSASKFKIDIVANDKATQAVGRIEKRFQKFTAPVTNLQKQFKVFKKDTGLDKVASGIGKIGSGARFTAERLAGVTAALAGIATVGSAEALARLGGNWLKTGYQIQMASQRIGISTARLQSLKGAAGLSGLDPEAMTGSLHALGGALQDAASNRNMQLANLMARLGIRLRRTKDGAVDAADAFTQLSSVLSKMPAGPQTKEMLAQQFGVGDMLPLLLKGPKGIQELEAKFNKTGAGLNKQTLENMAKLNGSLAALRYSVDGLGQTLASRLVPVLVPFVDKLTAWMNAHSDKVVDVPIKAVGFAANLPKTMVNKAGKVVSFNGPGKPLEYNWANPFQWIREGASFLGLTGEKGDPKAKSATDYFQKQGWSQAQSAGLVANLLKESNLNPNAVGDSGKAFGIAQWHADRQGAFQKWIGHDIRRSNLSEQLAFVNYELTRGGERAAGDRLRRAQTAAEAGSIASQYYERPKERGGEAVSRATMADTLSKHLNLSPGAVTPAKTEVEVRLVGVPDGMKANVKSTGPTGVRVYTANLGGGKL